MTTPQIILMVVLIVVVDLVIVGAVLYAATGTVREFSAKFPAREPKSDAVRKRFQSFRFDIVNLGSCIHVAVDEDHLHLDPAWLARKLGMKPMSISWDRMKVLGPSFGRFRVSVENTTITGPKWCFSVLEVAKPD